MGIRDGGNPPREQAIRATVVVNVVYNLNAPIFTGCTPQPRITLREDIASGINAYTATVSDSDVQVSVSLFLGKTLLRTISNLTRLLQWI